MFVVRRKVPIQRRFRLSHRPLHPSGSAAGALQLPAPMPASAGQIQADRGIHSPLALNRLDKGAAYTTWGSALAARGALGLAGASEAVAALGILTVLCTLFDVYNIVTNKSDGTQDYVMASLMLLHLEASQRRLEAEALRSGVPVDPGTQELVDFEIRTLRRMTANFEEAYYPRSQQPYLGRIRRNISRAAAQLGQCFADVDALAASCQALSEDRRALMQAIGDLDARLGAAERHDTTASSRQIERWVRRRAKALERLNALDEQLIAAAAQMERLKQAAKDGFDAVLGLLSRTHLRQQARDEQLRVRQQRADVQTLLRLHEQRADWLLAHGGPDGDQDQEVLLEIGSDIAALEHGLAPWGLAIADWTRRHGHPPDRQALADIAQSLIASLDAQDQALEREIEAFSTHAWTRVFSPYKGMGHQEIKRIRDFEVQLPMAVLSAASNILTIVQDVTGLIFSATGLPVITLLSCAFSLYYARGDNRDGKKEEKDAVDKQLRALQAVCRAAETIRHGRTLPDTREQAICVALGTAFMVCQQRAMKRHKRSALQARIRATKGLLNYGAVVLAVIGCIATLSTGGIALPALSLPVAAVSGGYLVSVGENILEHKFDNDHAKLRESIALAFVAHFGIAGVLDLYLAVHEKDKHRLARWARALDRFKHAWHHRLREDRDPIPTPHSPLIDWMTKPISLYVNEFLAIEFCTDYLHRQARDGEPVPGLLHRLLLDLGMSGDVLNLLGRHLKAYRTADDHRTAVRQFLAAFWEARLYPGHRLPAHILQRPYAVLRQLEGWLNQALGALPPDTVDPLHRLLLSMAAQPKAAMVRLHGADPALREALTDVLKQVGQHLSAHFIGPADLFGLQRELMAGQESEAPPPGEWLRGPSGPVWLELLADPSYWCYERPLKAPAGPSPASGAAALSHLVAAMKTVGDRLRRNRLRPRRVLDRQDSGQLFSRLSAWSLGHPWPGDPDLEQAALQPPGPPARPHPPTKKGDWRRRSVDEMALRRRQVVSRLRKAKPNPLASAAKVLAYLDEHRGRQTTCAVVCGQLLREWALRDGLPGPRPAAPPHLWHKALLDHLATRLQAAMATAKLGLQALDTRPQQFREDGKRLGAAKDQPVREHLQNLIDLCQALRLYLHHPSAQAQFMDLPADG